MRFQMVHVFIFHGIFLVPFYFMVESGAVSWLDNLFGKLLLKAISFNLVFVTVSLSFFIILNII